MELPENPLNIQEIIQEINVDDILQRSHVVALPMRVKFRGITTREALLINGPKRWGEFSPFTEYKPQEAKHWLRAGLEAAYLGLPEAEGAVPVNGTVPALQPHDVEGVLERFPGVQTFKVKVADPGQTLQDDVMRVNEVRRLRPEAAIRVDANGGWSVAEAVEAERALTEGGPLEYIEQPCKTVEELGAVQNQVRTPIAADESIRRAEDPGRVVGVVPVGVVKQAPLGGVRRTLQLAEALNLQLTVASALDTAVGIDAGLVAAKLTGSRAAGLATQRLFLEDVAPERQLHNGTLPLTHTTPDPERLHALRAPDTTRDWWFDRVRECITQLRV
ncbi:o-succinylbenzoate synthase [Corynebacterium sp. HMSC29G08]|uniref:o-succinylbenzoate synthase n=1 Tax=Corynebacterium sp. HMSC29G08 TaxID=1581069 RepID=UPI0008A1DC62|nr:o-succinylbenzoate synthase [Corynebacterium sp. HMSC29G08]OFT81376.1 O-succinylbenzoate synthase [Corynebacterium sp. HMSC29G08]